MEDIGDDEIETAMKKMKKGWVAGIDELRVEMLVVAEQGGIIWCTKTLLNTSMRKGNVPEEWEMG